MARLPQTHPERGFSCQIGPVNTFGRIPMDQTIEETINKDTQTARGTKVQEKILSPSITSLQMMGLLSQETESNALIRGIKNSGMLT